MATLFLSTDEKQTFCVPFNVQCAKVLNHRKYTLLFGSTAAVSEVNSKRMFMKNQLLYCKPQNMCYFLPERYPKYAYTKYHPETYVM